MTRLPGLRPAARMMPRLPIGGVGPYNFPAASRGDRFARSGLDLRPAIRGWQRFGGLIKDVARSEHIDPYVLGAYVWLESGFDPRQDYTRGPRRALGLGSVQATDNRRYSPEQLKEPTLNLTLTAREFAGQWHPNDMYGTVMDVWYPAWRRLAARGQAIPVVHSSDTYMQAFANRYYALVDVDKHLDGRHRKARRAHPASESYGRRLVGS